MSSDPVASMSDDHARVRELAGRLEEATRSGDAETASELAKELTRTLNAHAAIEEEVFYPAVINVAPDLVPQVEGVLEEHRAAKDLLYVAATGTSEVEESAGPGMPPTELLLEAVQHHVVEEEALFGTLRESDRASQVAKVTGEVLDERKNALHVVSPPPASADSEGEQDSRREKRAAKRRKKAAAGGGADLDGTTARWIPHA
jgi:hypothetical protein